MNNVIPLRPDEMEAMAPMPGPLAIPLPSFGLCGPIAYIQAVVADSYGTMRSDMTSPERKREVAWPRQVAMYLAATLTDKSLVVIGREFGGRDHTTVIHAIKAVTERMDKDPALRADVEAFRKALAA